MNNETSGPAVHRAALQGFSSQTLAYDRGRPDYPPQLSAWLTQTLRLGPGMSALDLGAGTGKFTQRLLTTGARVTAIEPLDAMRAQLLKNLPGVTAIAASAQSMPLEGASFDVVVCAQAFHWFAHRQALREIGRVLRPGGRLGLVWNVRDESHDWVAAITRIISPYEGDTPRFRNGDWRRLFPNDLFSDLRETAVSCQHVGSAQQVILERMLSVSFIASLPDTDRARVAGQLQALIATHPQLQGGSTIAFPYVTRAYCSTRAQPAA